MKTPLLKKGFLANSPFGTILLLSFLLMLILLQLRPIDDADIFTQITLGQLMIDQKSIINTEPFVFWRENSSISNPGWLAQLIFAVSYDFGGFSLVRLLHSIIFAGAFIIIAIANRKSLPPAVIPLAQIAIFVSTLLAFFFSGAFMSVRPQVFSLFGVAYVYFSCVTMRRNSLLLISLGIISLIWQNTHPSIVIGLPVILSFFFGHALSKSLNKSTTLHLLAISCIIIISFFLTPEGGNLSEISYRNLEISRKLLQVSEWMPIWDVSVRNEITLFWPLLGVIVISFILKPRLFNTEDFLLVIIFSCLSLYSARFSFYLALFLVNPLTSIITALFFRIHELRNINYNFSRAIPLLFGCFVFFQAILYILPNISPTFPHTAVQKLNQIEKPVNIFNYREWGGFLTFSSKGVNKVFIDGRLYLYSPEIWGQYNNFALGDDQTIISVLTNSSIDALVLHKQFFEAAIPKINGFPTWVNFFEDDQSIIFIKQNLLPLVNPMAKHQNIESFSTRLNNRINNFELDSFTKGETDFIQYWTANELLKNGRNAYNGKEMLVLQNSLGDKKGLATMMWNPPWLLTIMAPILEFEFLTSARIWVIINFILFLISSFITWHWILGQNKLSIGYVVSLLCFYPFWSCIGSGQIGIMLAFMFCLFILCLRRNYYFLAGVALVPLTTKPHLFYLLIPLFLAGLITKTGRLITASFFVWFFALLLLTEYLYAGAINTWLQIHLQQAWDGPFLSPLDFQPDTFVGVIRELYVYIFPFQGTGVMFMWLIPLITLSIVTLVIFKNCSWQNSEKYFSLLLCLSLFTSPYGWSSDQVLLLLPLSIIIARKNTTNTVLCIGSLLSLAVCANLFGGPLTYSWLPLILFVIYQYGDCADFGFNKLNKD